MKVLIKTRSEDELEDYDWRDELEIFIDDVSVFRVMDDEPEDSNLSRSFSDCHKIEKLMKQAYEAGINNEGFKITYE